MPAPAASAQLRQQNPQPTGWLQKRPKLGANDMELQRQQRRQEASHKKQRQEAARAAKRQRREGEGRFAQEQVKAKLRELQAQEANKVRELQGLQLQGPQAVKWKLRELQEKGEVTRPEPVNPIEEARKQLQALEICQTCPNCQWTAQKTKGCKHCLGQYSSKLRLTQYSLDHQRQVVSQLTGTIPV